MIMNLALSNFRKCRLWVDETNDLPQLHSQNSKSVIIPTNGEKALAVSSMILEVVLQKDHSYYAMIGFDYKKDISLEELTKITVIMTDEKQKYVSNTFTGEFDTVYAGISVEYGQSVLDSLYEVMAETNWHPAGEFIIKFGAFAGCGSSTAVFARATKALIRLAQLDLLRMTEKEIKTEIEQIL